MSRDFLEDIKEWNRIYWLEKNRMMPLHWTWSMMRGAYEKYLPRVWCRFECEDTTEEFEKAWQEFKDQTYKAYWR